jgi:hypothetical protein
VILVGELIQNNKIMRIKSLLDIFPKKLNTIVKIAIKNDKIDIFNYLLKWNSFLTIEYTVMVKNFKFIQEILKNNGNYINKVLINVVKYGHLDIIYKMDKFNIRLINIAIVNNKLDHYQLDFDINTIV